MVCCTPSYKFHFVFWNASFGRTDILSDLSVKSDFSLTMIFVDLFPGFCWLVWIKIEKLVRPFTYDKNQNCRENVTSTRYEGQIAKICFLNFTGRFPSILISNASPSQIFLIIPGHFRTKFIVIFDENASWSWHSEHLISVLE